MKVAPGKIAVKPFDDEFEKDGIIMPDSMRASQGVVVQVGAPQAELYGWWDMLLYALFKRNPCPFKEGMTVGIPRTPPVVDGLVIVWQHQIEYGTDKT